jgi:hypothetical protein
VVSECAAQGKERGSPDRTTTFDLESRWDDWGSLELCPAVTFGRLWGHHVVELGGPVGGREFAILPHRVLALPADIRDFRSEVRPPAIWRQLPTGAVLVGSLLLLVAAIVTLHVKLAYREFTPAQHEGAAMVRFSGIDGAVELPEAAALAVGPILVGGPPPSLVAQLEGRYHVKRTPNHSLRVIGGSLEDVTAEGRGLAHDAAWACCALTLTGLVTAAVAGMVWLGG